MNKLRRKGKYIIPAETRGKFNDKGRTIKKRPKEIYKRKETGHWEADTVESGRLDRKRKCSNYKTPKEVLSGRLLSVLHLN